MIIIIILSIIFLTVYSFGIYLAINFTLNTKQIPILDEYNNMDCLNKSNMILHLIDAYSFIIIGPFSIVSTLIAMGAFLFSEKVRR